MTRIAIMLVGMLTWFIAGFTAAIFLFVRDCAEYGTFVTFGKVIVCRIYDHREHKVTINPDKRISKEGKADLKWLR